MSLTKDLTTKPQPPVATHTIVPTGRRTGSTLPGSHLRMGMWVTWVGPQGVAVPGDDEKRVGIVTMLSRQTNEVKADRIDVHGLTMVSGIPMACESLTQATVEDIPRSRRASAAVLRAKGYVR